MVMPSSERVGVSCSGGFMMIPPEPSVLPLACPAVPFALSNICQQSTGFSFCPHFQLSGIKPLLPLSKISYNLQYENRRRRQLKPGHLRAPEARHPATGRFGYWRLGLAVWPEHPLPHRHHRFRPGRDALGIRCRTRAGHLFNLPVYRPTPAQWVAHLFCMSTRPTWTPL